MRKGRPLPGQVPVHAARVSDAAREVQVGSTDLNCDGSSPAALNSTFQSTACGWVAVSSTWGGIAWKNIRRPRGSSARLIIPERIGGGELSVTTPGVRSESRKSELIRYCGLWR